MSRERVTIGDVCDFVGGSQPPKSVFLHVPRDGYIRLIQTRDYKTDDFPTYIPVNSTTKFCTKDDIMIGRYGPPIFQICRGLEGAYNVALMKAKPKECINNAYLYYLLKQPSILKYVEKLSLRTGGQTGVDLFSLRNYPVLLPSKECQRKVEQVLGDLDEKIAINDQISKELECMARLLCDYWFVQFEFPISAPYAMALGKPSLEGKPYRAAGGKLVYNEILKREIPEGWKDGEINNLCSLNSNSWSSSDYPNSINYVDLANTKNGRIERTVVYNKNEAPSRAQRVLRAGDTIVGTVRPDNCSYAWVPNGNVTLTGSTGFAVLTPNKKCFREFNYMSLTSELNIKRLGVMASGAAYPAVNSEAVASLPIAVPPDSLIEMYHKATSDSFDLIEVNEAQNFELATLRDWLLPMLMNGQITVN